jgi:hypothetical protein
LNCFNATLNNVFDHRRCLWAFPIAARADWLPSDFATLSASAIQTPWLEVRHERGLCGVLDVNNSIEILYPPISAVKPSPHAARQHNRHQRRKLKRLLTKFGQVTPIIVDENYVIVDGHAVCEALVELGYEEIAVIVVQNRNEADIRALRLALNRLSQDTKWDDAKLRAEFEALLNFGFDLDLTAFDAVEVDMTLSIDTPTGNTVEEVAAADVEPQAGPTVTQPGDIWRLGRHVVACGDARDAGWLRALVGGARATTVFTAPPSTSRSMASSPGLVRFSTASSPWRPGR